MILETACAGVHTDLSEWRILDWRTDAGLPNTGASEVNPMNLTDHRFLLDVAYRKWRQLQDTYLVLAYQLSADAETRLAAVRVEIDRALTDYMAVDRESDVDAQCSSAESADAHLPTAPA